jgi:hypothetical protein
MKKIFTFLVLLICIKINSDFVDDDYYDIMSCIGTETNQCSKTTLKTKNLECCLFNLTHPNNKDYYYELCSAVFTNYVSQSMMKQIESIAIEDYGILKAYLDIDIPRIREDITCSKAKASYEFGGYTYTSTDLQKLKSKNHCLYYYYNSIGENLFKDTTVSIEKEKCINAESLDVTKSADIYCAYADVAILYADGSKSEFKTCYFLPSESIKSKKLDPTTEAALQKVSQKEASKDGKIVDEYEAKLVDKNGRSITYNSKDGVVAGTSSGKYSSLKFSLLVLLLTLIL